jgi:hypothetical protein
MKLTSLFFPLFLITIIFAIIFLSGCATQFSTNQTEKDRATAACIELCTSSLSNGQDLTNGPCLSNEIISNWVCDVAHSPRQAVDNLAENQCSAYREGLAKHFVEIDTNCDFIRVV